MNFAERMRPVKPYSVFGLRDEDFIVWCGSIAKGDDGLYYLYFSFWPREKGHDAWVQGRKIKFFPKK